MSNNKRVMNLLKDINVVTSVENNELWDKKLGKRNIDEKLDHNKYYKVKMFKNNHWKYQKERNIFIRKPNQKL